MNVGRAFLLGGSLCEEEHTALAQRKQTDKRFEQSRFAGAVRSNDGNTGTMGNIERNVAQNWRTIVSNGNIFDFEMSGEIRQSGHQVILKAYGV